MRLLSVLFAYGVSAAYVELALYPKNGSRSIGRMKTSRPAALDVHNFTTARSHCDTKRATSTVVITPFIFKTSSVVSAPSATPGGTGYMSIINEWRTKLGLSAFAQDAVLEANALKTCIDGNGQMVHELNSGSFAQVLAPGNINDEFERIFVGGWLCEKPDMAGMDGICATLSIGWDYSSTGHAEILTSKNYHKIGCASFNGITGCDLG